MRAERVLRRRERSRRAGRGDAGREDCKRAASVMKVVMAMAGLGQMVPMGKDRLLFRKRGSLGEV
jgi:hypothetical protein